jgi:hypothetical protein
MGTSFKIVYFPNWLEWYDRHSLGLLRWIFREVGIREQGAVRAKMPARLRAELAYVMHDHP